jgi:hypothetical protein
LQVRGQYVLQVPGTSFVIDGMGENSPFGCAPSLAVFANHSARPNARIESFPVLRPGPLEVRQHMMLVAAEPIAAGQEVRLNYEEGGEGQYWDILGERPAEGAWREQFVRPPPPSGEEPIANRLQELQTAAELKREAPPCSVPLAKSPVPWEGTSGGDARLHAIVPLLSTNSRVANNSAWPLVSTHVLGRSGRECRERWQTIQALDEHAGWLQAPAHGAVSHAEAAATMDRANRATALAAAAREDCSDDDDDDCPADSTSWRERCCISGCKRRLLQCFGQKRGGDSVGCAEESHCICAECLYRWLGSEASLRGQRGLYLQTRRTCPVCKCELRAAGSEIRADAERYVMGLLKVEASW